MNKKINTHNQLQVILKRLQDFDHDKYFLNQIEDTKDKVNFSFKHNQRRQRSNSNLTSLRESSWASQRGDQIATKASADKCQIRKPKKQGTMKFDQQKLKNAMRTLVVESNIDSRNIQTISEWD